MPSVMPHTDDYRVSDGMFNLIGMTGVIGREAV